MKETDQFEQNIIVEDAKKKVPQTKEDKKIDKMNSYYNSLETLEDKLDFLISQASILRANAYEGVVPTMKVELAYEKLLENFEKKYFVNGTDKTRSFIFKHLGERFIKNQIEGYNTYNQHLSKLPKEPALEGDKRGDAEKRREKKAMLLTKNSKSSMEQGGIQRVLMHIRTEYLVNNALRKKTYKESGINNETTMGEFAQKFKSPLDTVDQFIKEENTYKSKRKLKVIVDNPKNKNPNYKANEPAKPDTKIFEMYYDPSFATDRIMDHFVNDNLKEGIKKVQYSLNMSDDQYKVIDSFYNKKLKPDFVEDEVDPEWAKRNVNRIASPSTARYDLETELDNRFIKKEKAPKVLDKSLNEKQTVDLIISMYENQKTVSDKLKFIVDLDVKFTCRQKLGLQVNKSETKAHSELVDKFINDYVKNGTFVERREIFTTFGDMFSKNNLALWKHEEKHKQVMLEEDKKDKKATFLARNSIHGVRMAILNSNCHYIKSAYLGCQELYKKTIEQNVINKDTTMHQLAILCGCNNQEQVSNFCIEKGAPGEAKVFDHYKKMITDELNPNPTDDAVYHKIAQDMMEYQSILWADQGGAENIKKANLTPEQLKSFTDTAKKTLEEVSHNSIEDWIKGEGGKIASKIKEKDCKEFIVDFDEKYDNSRGFNKYIRLHSGMSVYDAANNTRIDCLAKSIAATLMMEKGEKFDVKKIHAMANAIKTTPKFKEIASDHNDLNNALYNTFSVIDAKNEIVNSTYSVPDDHIIDYINDMNKVIKNFMTPVGRSKEFKALYETVKQISDISGKYDLKNEKELAMAKEELINLNATLLSNINIYTNGKERVRTTTNGKLRFNNAIEALTTLTKHTPNIKAQSQIITDRINKIRKASVGAKDHIDLQKVSKVANVK